MIALPKPVETYLAAERNKDSGLLSRCFAPNAVVHDESRDYRGIEEIQAWKRDADAKYRYVMEPLDAALTDGAVRVHARLTGEFPGSPVEVDYTFKVEGDHITSLTID